MYLLGSSVAVERGFSKGRILLPHLRNRLDIQSTRALLCLGDWSKMKLIKNEDLLDTARLPEADAEEDEELAKDWDKVVIA